MQLYRTFFYQIILLAICYSLTGQITDFKETYTYDQAGRLTAVNHSNEASISYTYDPSGNLIQLESVAGTVAVEEPGVESANTGLTIYPNPLSSQSTIQYSLMRPTEIELSVHDAVGKLIKVVDQGMRVEGIHTVQWDGKSTSGTKIISGVYTCRLKSGESVRSIKMIVVN